MRKDIRRQRRVDALPCRIRPTADWNPISGLVVWIRLEEHCLKEAAMPSAAPSKADKIEHPQSHYATPDELIDDRALSRDEKIKALKIWEQDARQMLTASGEGMPGSEEGIDPDNHNMLGQVERARGKLDTAPGAPRRRS
jgi:hypothetical protein